MKSESTIAGVTILAGLLSFLPMLLGDNHATPAPEPRVAPPVPVVAGVADPGPVRMVAAPGFPTPALTPRDETLLAAALDPAIVAVGKDNYANFCLACHGPENTTIDSPSNLFNGKWHHGGTPTALERSILVGYLELGMPGWGEILPPEDTTALTAYLLSFQR